MKQKERSVEEQRFRRWSSLILVGIALVIVIGWLALRYRAADTLLNVSYSATEAFHRDLNTAFMETRPNLKIKMSHAGSVEQVALVAGGAKADVAVLASASDIDSLAERSYVDTDWRERFPNGSSPFYSTIVFVVRSGNPLEISDWTDLAKDGVNVLMPSPHVSGAGRWAYLAAWGALQSDSDDPLAAQRAMETIYANTSVLEKNASFVLSQFLNGSGDVAVTWENQALSAAAEDAGSNIEIVYPSRSIRAEPVLAVIDRSANRRGTREAAEEYLRFFFSAAAQEIATGNYLRPQVESSAATAFGTPEGFSLFTVEEAFGDWDKAVDTHFSEGGTFDRIYRFEINRRKAR